MAKQAFEVTMEVRVVVAATSRAEAVLRATEPNHIAARLESIRVTDIFCPAEGR